MLTEQGLILETAFSELTTTTARRILIVDDNRDSATSLAMLLKLNWQRHAHRLRRR